MNKQSQFLKIFFIAAFLLLMFISAWATVESLHLLLPEWPVAFFWGVSLVFFFLSSLGTKLITDSFNQSKRIDGRIWRLLGGILLLLAFWIVCILPTNTHTFFYKAKSKQVLTDELSYTKGKLQDLENKGEAGKIIDQEKDIFKTKILSFYTNYANEINNPGNIGSGKRADSILLQLDNALGNRLNRMTLKSQNINDRRIFLDAMKKQVNDMMTIKLTEYDTKLNSINRGVDKSEITSLKNYFVNIQKIMSNNPTNNNEPTVLTKNNLIRAFRIINKYSDDLKKTYPNSKALLDYPSPKTVQLDSVVDVWKSFFQGEYKGEGFLFWIIVAALIDIAGFIMFALAFRSED